MEDDGGHDQFKATEIEPVLSAWLVF
uniref:Uncharacterized protein n=1 Tax=Rhizophora mucronata TaxID=61149 RepID=A0A2P2QWP7_RHIMU